MGYVSVVTRLLRDVARRDPMAPPRAKPEVPTYPIFSIGCAWRHPGKYECFGTAPYSIRIADVPFARSIPKLEFAARFCYQLEYVPTVSEFLPGNCGEHYGSDFCPKRMRLTYTYIVGNDFDASSPKVLSQWSCLATKHCDDNRQQGSRNRRAVSSNLLSGTGQKYTARVEVLQANPAG